MITRRCALRRDEAFQFVWRVSLLFILALQMACPRLTLALGIFLSRSLLQYFFSSGYSVVTGHGFLVYLSNLSIKILEMTTLVALECRSWYVTPRLVETAILRRTSTFAAAIAALTNRFDPLCYAFLWSILIFFFQFRFLCLFKCAISDFGQWNLVSLHLSACSPLTWSNKVPSTLLVAYATRQCQLDRCLESLDSWKPFSSYTSALRFAKNPASCLVRRNHIFALVLSTLFQWGIISMFIIWNEPGRLILWPGRLTSGFSIRIPDALQGTADIQCQTAMVVM
jgi:hypothetical protein